MRRKGGGWISVMTPLDALAPGNRVKALRLVGKADNRGNPDVDPIDWGTHLITVAKRVVFSCATCFCARTTTRARLTCCKSIREPPSLSAALTSLLIWKGTLAALCTHCLHHSFPSLSHLPYHFVCDAKNRAAHHRQPFCRWLQNQVDGWLGGVVHQIWLCSRLQSSQF